MRWLQSQQSDLLVLSCPQKKRSLLSLGPRELWGKTTQHTGRGRRKTAQSSWKGLRAWNSTWRIWKRGLDILKLKVKKRLKFGPSGLLNSSKNRCSFQKLHLLHAVTWGTEESFRSSRKLRWHRWCWRAQLLPTSINSVSGKGHHFDPVGIWGRHSYQWERRYPCRTGQRLSLWQVTFFAVCFL